MIKGKKMFKLLLKTFVLTAAELHLVLIYIYAWVLHTAHTH